MGDRRSVGPPPPRASACGRGGSLRSGQRVGMWARRLFALITTRRHVGAAALRAARAVVSLVRSMSLSTPIASSKVLLLSFSLANSCRTAASSACVCAKSEPSAIALSASSSLRCISASNSVARASSVTAAAVRDVSSFKANVTACAFNANRELCCAASMTFSSSWATLRASTSNVLCTLPVIA